MRGSRQPWSLHLQPVPSHMCGSGPPIRLRRAFPRIRLYSLLVFSNTPGYRRQLSLYIMTHRPQTGNHLPPSPFPHSEQDSAEHGSGIREPLSSRSDPLRARVPARRSEVSPCRTPFSAWARIVSVTLPAISARLAMAFQAVKRPLDGLRHAPTTGTNGANRHQVRPGGQVLAAHPHLGQSLLAGKGVPYPSLPI